jgi:hypothetical protein
LELSKLVLLAAVNVCSSMMGGTGISTHSSAGRTICRCPFFPPAVGTVSVRLK